MPASSRSTETIGERSTGLRMRSYFGVSAGFTFGRVLPQAVLTPILLDKGLDFDTIIWTQLIATTVLAVAELPSGLLADRYSRKWLYVASIVLVALAYSIIWWGSGLAVMGGAWALYAVGMAMNSSTMDMHFATVLRGDDRAFRRFFVVDRNVVLGATMVSAGATAVLYPLLGPDVYALSIIAFLCSAVWGAFALPRTVVVRRTHQGPAPRLIATLRANPAIVLSVLLFVVMQLAFTPFFQLWQMVFLESGVAAGWFGVIFVLFQAVNIAANATWSRLPHRSWMSFVLLLVLALVGCGLLLSDGLVRVLLIVTLPFPLFLYSNTLLYSVQSRAPAALLSSLNAFMGSASTIGALVTLGLCLVGLGWSSPGVVLAVSLVCCAGSSAVLLLGSMAVRGRAGPSVGRPSA